jgi:hypothetical protein
MVVDEDLGDPQATGLTKAQAEAEAQTWNDIEEVRRAEDRGEVPMPQGFSLEDLTLTPAPALQEALDKADAAIQADPEGKPFVEHLREALKPSATEKAAARKALKEAQEDAQVAAILDQVPALRPMTKAQQRRADKARAAMGLPPIQAEAQKAPRTTRKAAEAQAQVAVLERQCHGLPKRGVEPHMAPTSDFGSNAGTKDGLSNQCRQCCAKYRELKQAQGLVRVPTQAAQEAAQAVQA